MCLKCVLFARYAAIHYRLWAVTPATILYVLMSFYRHQFHFTLILFNSSHAHNLMSLGGVNIFNRSNPIHKLISIKWPSTWTHTHRNVSTTGNEKVNISERARKSTPEKTNEKEEKNVNLLSTWKVIDEITYSIWSI